MVLRICQVETSHAKAVVSAGWPFIRKAMLEWDHCTEQYFTDTNKQNITRV